MELQPAYLKEKTAFVVNFVIEIQKRSASKNDRQVQPLERKMTTMGVKLDDEVRTRLKALGECRDRTPHWLMKTAITEF